MGFWLPPGLFLILSIGGLGFSLWSGPFDATKLAAFGQWLGGLATIIAISGAFYQIAEQRHHDHELRLKALDLAERSNWYSLRLDITRTDGGTLEGPTQDYAETSAIEYRITLRHLGATPLIDVRVVIDFSAPVLVEPVCWEPPNADGRFALRRTDETVGIPWGHSAARISGAVVHFGDIAPNEVFLRNFRVGVEKELVIEPRLQAQSLSDKTWVRSVAPRTA